MVLEAQNGVPHVAIVRGLHAAEENDAFQLHGVAYHAAPAHQGGVPDKGAVPDPGARADDAGRAQERRGGGGGGFVDPDAGGMLPILRRGPRVRIRVLTLSGASQGYWKRAR